MFDLKVQRLLIGYLRQNVPLSLKAENDGLRVRYGASIRAAMTLQARRDIGRDYRQARAAMIIRIARLVSQAGD